MSVLKQNERNPPPACKSHRSEPQQELKQLCELDWGEKDRLCILYLRVAYWPIQFTPLPGHERLQHSHVLFGEIVLSHHVLQRLQVARNHAHRLHLVLALNTEEHDTRAEHQSDGLTQPAEWIVGSEFACGVNTNLEESEQHQQRRHKAVPLEGGGGEGFPEECICDKASSVGSNVG